MCANLFSWFFKEAAPEKSTGEAGEAFATKVLTEKGYKLLARNWRCSLGEIDIVAKGDDCLIIVEVKSSERRGNIPPELRVNAKKQQKLKQLAAAYQKTRHQTLPVRFDVVAVWGKETLEFKHIENAFS